MGTWILPTSQTMRTLMMKLMLCSYHSWIHGLMRARVTGVVPSITPVVSDLSSSCGTWPHSCCPVWGSSWGTSHCLAFAKRLAGCRDMSWLQKLNGLDAGIMDQGWPGPLGLMCPLVMAWVINHLPLPRLMGLVLICAYLPTHAIIPDNINVASLTSPKFSPSPNELHP